MIARKVSLTFFINLVIHILGFLSLYFVAHRMGPQVVGIISFAFAYIGMFRAFSDLGFGSAHIKRVSEGKDFGRCNGTYFMVKSLLTILMTIVVLITIFVTKFAQHKSFISRQHELVLYIILLSTVIGNFSMMFLITFSARKETAKQNVPLLIGKIVETPGKILVAIAGWSVIFLAGAHLVSTVVTLLFFIYLFRDYPIKKPNMEYFKSYATFALPVMFIGFLSSISQNLDKVMIQFFWSTVDVGHYSAAQRISFILSFITTASITLIFPTISAYHAKGNIENIRNVSNRAERYLSMIFFPVVAFIFVFSQPICQILLGTKFIPAAPILMILSLVALVDGISQPYTQQTGGTNRIVLAAKLSTVTFGLNILLNLLLIPRKIGSLHLLGMGSIGAAIGTLISIIVGSVLFRIYAYKITGSKPMFSVLLHLIAATIMGTILHLISKHITDISWYHLILFAFLGIILYIGVLYVFHEFTKNDLNLFLNILNPIKLKNYIIIEIKGGYSHS